MSAMSFLTRRAAPSIPAEATPDLGSIAIAENELLQERIASLELAMQDPGWIALSASMHQEFSRQGLINIVNAARLSYIKNPLINRGVEVKRLYVWGQGINVSCKDDNAADAIREFLECTGNARALFGHQARGQAEVELQVTGNLFLMLFADDEGMDVRVVPVEEIIEILHNPEDRTEPWYYRREWTTDSGVKVAYYRDWAYSPETGFVDERITEGQLSTDAMVYHVKVGGFLHWAFGVSEVYSALDWARAYKTLLENWASIVAAYARFAYHVKTPGGPGAIANIKQRIGSAFGAGGGVIDSNPPPTTASMALTGKETTIDPLKTAGATTSPGDGVWLLRMVCAAVGLPETFFGDASVGSLATAKSLDRPTEFNFRDRQELWESVYQDLINIMLEATGVKPANPVQIDFPEILEHDAGNYMNALVAGATLNGHPSITIPDMRTLSGLVLKALGETDIDDTLDKMFPEDEKGNPVPATPAAAPAEAEFVQALAKFRETLSHFAESEGVPV